MPHRAAPTPRPPTYFSDRRTLTRGGSAGDLAVRYIPAAGSVLCLIAGNIVNQEASAAIVTRARILDSLGNQLAYIFNASINANTNATYPHTTTGTTNLNTSAPIEVTSAQILEARAVTVSATEDFVFSFHGKYTGSTAPTVTEVNA